ncbi:MAG TPA: heavy metal translocating P-type ATPase, partial [Paracoccaceae bacterium]|nr:heavy metal translocating P-type ATPase [Paracoccaceae bacterium]
TVEVAATGEATLIAEIARMVAAAEAGRNRYTRLADRAARLYSPTVHLAALATFIGWSLAGLPGREALMIAASVLIITCPCALGLAVPAVQAAIGGRLFRRAVFVKDGTALERLSEADCVVFDKTGTLTTGRPELAGMPADPEVRAAALAFAEASRHPYARAIAEALRAAGVTPAAVTGLAEHPGAGVEGRLGSRRLRFGRAAWCGAEGGTGAEVWLTGLGAPLVFRLADRLKPDAAETVAALKRRGLRVLLFSGDAPEAVREAAEAAGIAEWRAGMTPQEKLTALRTLAREGWRVAMVGDGINDAPALAAAHVSISPASATDIARTAADYVIPAGQLRPVRLCHEQARLARRRALENFALAALYNLVAIPVAVAGHVTPLVAALAMAGSSILVTLNALRPGRAGDRS